MVDIDGDGLISYQEFMLFRTLLAIPPRTVRFADKLMPIHDEQAERLRQTYLLTLRHDVYDAH